LPRMRGTIGQGQGFHRHHGAWIDGEPLCDSGLDQHRSQGSSYSSWTHNVEVK